MRVTWQGLKETVAFWARGAAPGEQQLLDDLAAATRNAVRDQRIAVERVGPAIRVSSATNGVSSTIMVGFFWRLPLPEDERLKRVFRAYASELQDIMSRVRRESWPAPGSRPHIELETEAVVLWWDGGSHDDRLLALDPVSRPLIEDARP